MSFTDAAPPQFDAPFRLDTNGQVVTVDQDSPEEIGAAVYNIVVCPQGAKLNDPEFGIPSPLFQNVPIDLNAITKAIAALEPRATVSGGQQLTIGAQIIEIVNQLLPGLELPGADVIPADSFETTIETIQTDVSLIATVSGGQS